MSGPFQTAMYGTDNGGDIGSPYFCSHAAFRCEEGAWTDGWASDYGKNHSSRLICKKWFTNFYFKERDVYNVFMHHV